MRAICRQPSQQVSGLLIKLSIYLKLNSKNRLWCICHVLLPHHYIRLALVDELCHLPSYPVLLKNRNFPKGRDNEKHSRPGITSERLCVGFVRHIGPLEWSSDNLPRSWRSKFRVTRLRYDLYYLRPRLYLKPLADLYIFVRERIASDVEYAWDTGSVRGFQPCCYPDQTITDTPFLSPRQPRIDQMLPCSNTTSTRSLALQQRSI